MKTPEFPEPGFYYHYKHDPSGTVNNYAYEVVRGGHYTEDDLPQAPFFVCYLPLYEDATVYKLGRLFDVRPLELFMRPVLIGEDHAVPRFRKITDPAVIAELAAIKKRLYD